MHLRIWAVAIGAVVVVVGLAASAAFGSPTAGLVVEGCAQSATVMNPGVTPSASGERLVFGVASLPDSTTLLAWPSTPSDGRDRWIKHGLAIKAGDEVLLEVPTSFQSVYGLDFHAMNARTVSQSPKIVRFTACPARDGAWTIWAGGYLIAKPACVALIIAADGRSTRISLALGRRC